MLMMNFLFANGKITSQKQLKFKTIHSDQLKYFFLGHLLIDKRLYICENKLFIWNLYRHTFDDLT